MSCPAAVLPNLPPLSSQGNRHDHCHITALEFAPQTPTPTVCKTTRAILQPKCTNSDRTTIGKSSRPPAATSITKISPCWIASCKAIGETQAESAKGVSHVAHVGAGEVYNSLVGHLTCCCRRSATPPHTLSSPGSFAVTSPLCSSPSLRCVSSRSLPRGVPKGLAADRCCMGLERRTSYLLDAGSPPHALLLPFAL